MLGTQRAEDSFSVRVNVNGTLSLTHTQTPFVSFVTWHMDMQAAHCPPPTTHKLTFELAISNVNFLKLTHSSCGEWWSHKLENASNWNQTKPTHTHSTSDSFNWCTHDQIWTYQCPLKSINRSRSVFRRQLKERDVILCSHSRAVCLPFACPTPLRSASLCVASFVVHSLALLEQWTGHTHKQHGRPSR